VSVRGAVSSIRGRLVICGAATEPTATAVRALAATHHGVELVLVDRDAAGLAALDAEFTPSVRRECVVADVADLAARPELVAGAELVVNGVRPWRTSVQWLVPLCLEHRVDYLDFCDEPDTVRWAFLQDPLARRRGVNLLVACDVGTGLAGLIVDGLADRLDVVTDVRVATCRSDDGASRLSRPALAQQLDELVELARTQVPGDDRALIDFPAPIGRRWTWSAHSPVTATLSQRFTDAAVTATRCREPRRVDVVARHVGARVHRGSLSTDAGLDLLSALGAGRLRGLTVRKHLRDCLAELQRDGEMSASEIRSLRWRELRSRGCPPVFGLVTDVCGLRDGAPVELRRRTGTSGVGGPVADHSTLTGQTAAALASLALVLRRSGGVASVEQWTDLASFERAAHGIGMAPGLLEPTADNGPTVAALL